MQRLTMVRYRVKPDAIEENERLSRAVFEEVQGNAPEGIAYALFRDGDEFMHLFANLRADDADALVALPSFAAYQKDLAARCATPPEATRIAAELVKRYGLG